MGGGGRTGGGMFRTARRAVRAGANTFSSTQNNSPTGPTTTTHKPSTSKCLLSLSTSTTTPSPSSSPPRTLSRAPSTRGINSCPFSADEFEWECVDEVDSDKANGFSDDCVFVSPPSIHEVEDALLSLQEVMHPVFVRDRMLTNSDKDVAEEIVNPAGVQRGERALLTNSHVDWIEPSRQLCDWRMLQSHGSNMVYDAFHLLETEPSIQRMVVSLSSDKAVWDAVLNNEVVRELRESFDKGLSSTTVTKAEENVKESSDESLDNNRSITAASALRWIFENMKAKFTEAIANVTKLVTELFQHPDHEKKENNDAFMEKLKAPFVLTVAVLLVVVVTRAHRP